MSTHAERPGLNSPARTALPVISQPSLIPASALQPLAVDPVVTVGIDDTIGALNIPPVLPATTDEDERRTVIDPQQFRIARLKTQAQTEVQTAYQRRAAARARDRAKRAQRRVAEARALQQRLEVQAAEDAAAKTARVAAKKKALIAEREDIARAVAIFQTEADARALKRFLKKASPQQRAEYWAEQERAAASEIERLDDQLILEERNLLAADYTARLCDWQIAMDDPKIKKQDKPGKPVARMKLARINTYLADLQKWRDRGEEGYRPQRPALDDEGKPPATGVRQEMKAKAKSLRTELVKRPEVLPGLPDGAPIAIGPPAKSDPDDRVARQRRRREGVKERQEAEKARVRAARAEDEKRVQAQKLKEAQRAKGRQLRGLNNRLAFCKEEIERAKHFGDESKVKEQRLKLRRLQMQAIAVRTDETTIPPANRPATNGVVKQSRSDAHENTRTEDFAQEIDGNEADDFDAALRQVDAEIAVLDREVKDCDDQATKLAEQFVSITKAKK